jgi:hypothetical protein
VFDRTLDVRSGSGNMIDPNLPMTSQSASGQYFFTTSASVELQHTWNDRYGLRAGLSWRALELLSSLDSLPTYSTLGPMQSIEASAIFGRNFRRHRFELPLRYRLSYLYAGTWRNVLSASRSSQPMMSSSVAPGNTSSISASPCAPKPGSSSLRRPHLCTRLDPLLVVGDRCSIDGRVRGIRGNDNPPPLEVAAGPLATLSFGGEVSLSYVGPRRRFDLRLTRGYEPDAYAGALTLWDRLGGDFVVRPKWNWPSTARFS